MSDSPSYDTPPHQQSTSKSGVVQQPTAQQNDFDSEFCKNYANIKFSHTNATFEERMQFDIYRRETKMERYEVLKNATKKKIPGYQRELAFQRLQKDSERRILQKDRINELFNNESQTSKKKMSIQDIERQYNKFMEYENNKKEIIEEKKKLQQFQKEIEINEIVKSANKGKMPVKNLENMLNKFEIDNEERKMKLEKRRRELQINQEKQFEGLFHPKTNANYARDNKSVYARMQEDVEKRVQTSQTISNSKVFEGRQPSMSIKL